jgi:hypothetical protein
MLLAAACIQLWDIPAIGEVIQDQARIFHELLKLQHICKWLQWCWLRLPHAHGAQSFKQGVGRLLGGCSCTCLFATGWLLGGRARLLCRIWMGSCTCVFATGCLLIGRARILAEYGELDRLIARVLDHNNFTCLLSILSSKNSGK